jgi:hypothetical protein
MNIHSPDNTARKCQSQEVVIWVIEAAIWLGEDGWQEYEEGYLGRLVSVPLIWRVG